MTKGKENGGGGGGASTRHWLMKRRREVCRSRWLSYISLSFIHIPHLLSIIIAHPMVAALLFFSQTKSRIYKTQLTNV